MHRTRCLALVMLDVRGERKQIPKEGMMADREYPLNECSSARRYPTILAACWLVLCISLSAKPACAEWPHVVLSKDGTAISYEVYGAGEQALVFVHGWSCDARDWRAQLPYFSKRYRLVTLDLAGHGHSGMTRLQYTMKAFGEDVQAVTEATGSRKVILVGHSMGGSVIAEAARLMPNRVVGLIIIDTLENIEYPMTQEELHKMIAPLKTDCGGLLSIHNRKCFRCDTIRNRHERI